MAENTLPSLPDATAVTRPRRQLSAVWIIPIIAALMGGWIAVQKLLAEGPRIEITFSSAEGLEAGRTIARNRAKEEGKPEKIWDKIVEGRLEKYYQEVCLLKQPFVKDEALTVAELLKQTISAIGENVIIRRFTRWELGESAN